MSDTIDIYFDFEFNPTYPHFFPLSLGMTTRDGSEKFYIEYDFLPHEVDPWLRDHVLPHLEGKEKVTRDEAAGQILEWLKKVAGDKEVRFLGYCPEHDWVLLCQHWSFDTHPKFISRKLVDLRQLADFVGCKTYPQMPEARPHHALDDAIWCAKLHDAIEEHQKYYMRDE